MSDTKMEMMVNTIQKLDKKIAEIANEDIKQTPFIMAACMALSRDPKLLDCDKASIQLAVVQAAEDGLMLDGKEAALVAFGKTCTYMPMVQGIVKKAKMYGDVKDMRTNMIYENDMFHWVEGDEPRIEHEPTLSDRGAMIGGYVIVTMKDGSLKRLVMGRDDLERIRATSKQPNGIWQKHYTSMCAKTLIRQISKEINMSPEAQKVIRNIDTYYDMAPAVTATTVESTPIGVPNPAVAALQQPQEEKATA